MSENKLGRMANQIAGFFQSYPEDQAIAGIQDHLIAFWTPKMRAILAEAIAVSPEGTHPLVVAAVRNGLSRRAIRPSARWPDPPRPANSAPATRGRAV